MTRLQNAQQAETTHLTVRPCGAAPAEKDILEAEDRVRRQEAQVLRLIVQGAPTQFAEDQLRQLMATVEAMKAQLRLARE